MPKKPKARAAAKAPKPRKNGRVLTAKQLSKRAYATIHALPHGVRGPVLHALLEAAADLADAKPNWYEGAIHAGLVVKHAATIRAVTKAVAAVAKGAGTAKAAKPARHKPGRVRKTLDAAARPARDGSTRSRGVRRSAASQAPEAAGQGTIAAEAAETSQGESNAFNSPVEEAEAPAES